jgi:hypothetical protein
VVVALASAVSAPFDIVGDAVIESPMVWWCDLIQPAVTPWRCDKA